MKFLFERRVNHSSYELRIKVSKFHSDVLLDEYKKIEVITDKTVTETEEPIVTSNVNEASSGVVRRGGRLCPVDAKKLCEVERRGGGGRCETCRC